MANDRQALVASIAAILLAGGSGRRLAQKTQDKTLLMIGGKPVIQYSLEAFSRSEYVEKVVVVFRDEAQRQAIAETVPDGLASSMLWARGGEERQDSVWAGLQTLPRQTEVVLIHDGARPMIASQAIDQVALAARDGQVACVARSVTDTIKKRTYTDNGYVLNTLNRDELWAMETPQAFRYSLIHDAYAKIIYSGWKITDDLAAIESQSIPTTFIENPTPNPKLTNAEDIAYLEFLRKRFPC